MAIWQMLTGKLMTPRVVHSLPGRLRVHIPALTHLPEDMKPLAEKFQKIVEVSSTIDKASLNLKSGNILICYCHKKVKEDEVVGFLSRTLQLFLDNKDKFTGQVRDLDKVVTKLCSYLKTSITPNLYFPEEVPEDVWS